MAQAMPEIWKSVELNTASAADIRSNAKSVVSKNARRKRKFRSIFLHADDIAVGSFSGMPPIAQFVLHAVAWCKAKLIAGASEPATLKLVSRLALGGKRSLSLIEADGVRFLVGGGVDSVTIIVPVTPAASNSEENLPYAYDPARMREKETRDS